MQRELSALHLCDGLSYFQLINHYYLSTCQFIVCFKWSPVVRWMRSVKDVKLFIDICRTRVCDCKVVYPGVDA